MNGGSRQNDERPSAHPSSDNDHIADEGPRATRDGFARAGITARAGLAVMAGTAPFVRPPANDDLPAGPPHNPGFRAEALLVMAIVALGYVNAAAQLFA